VIKKIKLKQPANVKEKFELNTKVKTGKRKAAKKVIEKSRTL
jgi:hypothetical protein